MTIVIPYRNRAQHLAQFLKHYRRIFPDAYFLVVEQSWQGLFNKAKLFNVAILEHPADYYVFHDVDMLAQGVVNYEPDENNVVHCATNASQFQWAMPYPEYFGGVVIMTYDQIVATDGWSNRFEGWSGEDDEMYWQCLRVGLTIHHRQHRHLSLPHPKSHPVGYVPERMAMAKSPRPEGDGLQYTKYEVIEQRDIPQGKIITVEI